VARDGTLAYRSGANSIELVWLDRGGRKLSMVWNRVPR
jgi:hypothetical protein